MTGVVRMVRFTSRGTVLVLAVAIGCSAPEPRAPESKAPPPPSVTGLALTGKDGKVTIPAGNNVVNQYTSLIADAAAGATSIQVASRAALNSPAHGVLAAGDLLLIIQMQGATI